MLLKGAQLELALGDPGAFTYAAVAGRGERPVNFVSFWDAVRFANWLHNGQPVGAQDATTTEGGAYTITAAGVSGNSITRNLEATSFLPSEDEWYKAACYDPVSESYFLYPAGTDVETSCASPGPTPNTANEADNAGFRVATVPEPGRRLALLAAMGALGLVARRRHRR